MQRRTFLATAGTLLTAGCGAMKSSDRGNGPGAHVDGFMNESNDTEFSFDNLESNRKFSMGNGGDVNFEFNESSFEANFDNGFGEASGPTPTPIETNPRATKLMNKAMEGIQETYTAYVGYAGPNATLMDIDSSMDSFNASRVQRLAQQARDPLEKATEFAPEGQKNIILSLVQVTIFLEDLARVRKALRNAYDEFLFAVERLYAESALRAKRTAIIIDQYRSEAKSLFEPLKNEIDAEAVSVFKPIGNVYEEKMDQIRAELDAYRNVESGVRDGAKGINAFQKGVPAFYVQNYEKSLSPLDSAQFYFGSAEGEFGTVDESTGMEDKANEVAAVMAALSSAAANLSTAAKIKVENGSQPDFFEARRGAVDAIESNDIASEMNTARKIIT